MKNKDPRKFHRHKLENTFVINQEGICQVLDISLGGVSFGCTSEQKIPESLNIDVVNNSGIHVWNLPIKVIWAEKITTELFSSLYVSRYGASFDDDLTSEHLSAITEILNYSQQDLETEATYTL